MQLQTPDSPEDLIVEEDEEDDRQHASEHQSCPVDVEPEKSGSVTLGGNRLHLRYMGSILRSVMS